MGSARAVNRRYISDCVPPKLRMKASAGFVTASALGMACGPALACLFQVKFKFFRLTFNDDTLPGWFMALAWLVYLVCLCISFKEPPKPEFNILSQESNRGKKYHHYYYHEYQNILLLHGCSSNICKKRPRESDGKC